MLAVWLLCSALSVEDPTPVRHVEDVAVDARAGSASVVHRTQVAGRLRAWVESSAFDALLVAEDATGAQLAEDDDSGGRPTPWIDLTVVPGQSVRFVVRAKDGAGPARLVTVELAETEAWRTAAQEARADLDTAVDGLATEAAREQRVALSALALRLCEHEGLATSDALQAVLELVLEALANAADHPGALSAAERLIAVQREILPPDSVRRLRASLQQGSALGQLGRPAEGIEALTEALTTLRRTLDPTDRARCAAESALGNLLFVAGDMRGGVERWEAALRGFDPTLPADVRAAVQMYANLAVGWFYLGDLERAREHVERARALGTQVVAGSPLDQQIRSTLSAIVTEQGDTQAGRILAEESLAFARAKYPPGHVETAMAELNLALAQVRAGEDAAAHAVLARILAHPPPELAPEHSLIVQARLNLAAVDLRLGDLESAERGLSSLMDQFAGRLPSTHALLRATLRNRSIALRGLGRLDEAAEIDAELLDATREALPPDHPERLRVEFQCVGTDALRGLHAESSAACLANSRVLRDMLSSRALILSTREAEATARGLSILVDIALDTLLSPEIAAVAPEAAPLAFELCETARGLGIAAARSLRAVEAGGAAARELREVARRAQLELVRAARAGDPAQLQQAVERRDAAERALRESLAVSQFTPRAISAMEVARRLETNEVAVAWRVSLRSRNGDPRQFETESALMAYLVQRDGPIRWVDLGPVAPIEAACRAWRSELERVPFDRGATRAAGQRVRELVVDPIRTLAPEARRWTVAPDGPLLTLPLDALPDPRTGDELLGDHLRIHTVWSFDTDARRSVSPGSAADQLVVVGDPEFGSPAEGVRPRWASLAASGREIDAVTSIWRSTHAADAPVQMLRGAEASSARFAERVPAARWLHVATHGAFDADEAPGSLLTASSDDLSQDFGRSVRALVPLVRCELVLAGANADHDATLSAEELGALDLRGCELAVLSACDTGRGEIINGQGVASFQRALVAAGARGCVTSLWRVPDEATRELMSVFYRGLWEQKLGPAEALWRAKNALRARRAPPRDWAAWVLASPFAE